MMQKFIVPLNVGFWTFALIVIVIKVVPVLSR